MRVIWRGRREGSSDPVVTCFDGRWWIGDRELVCHERDGVVSFVRPAHVVDEALSMHARVVGVCPSEGAPVVLRHGRVAPRSGECHDPALVTAQGVRPIALEGVGALGGLVRDALGFVFVVEFLGDPFAYLVRVDERGEELARVQVPHRQVWGRELVREGDEVFWLTQSGPILTFDESFEVTSTLPRAHQGPAAVFDGGRGVVAASHDRVQWWAREGDRWIMTDDRLIPEPLACPFWLTCDPEGEAVVLAHGKRVGFLEGSEEPVVCRPRVGPIVGLERNAHREVLVVGWSGAVGYALG